MSFPVHPHRGACCATTTDERGFTLIELLIVMVLVPIIVGALALSLVSVFSLQSSVSNRLGDSGNSQAVVASYTKDVQTAAAITTSASPSVTCGSGTQVLGLERGSGQYISYDEIAQSTGTLYSLVRNECASSATLTSPISTQTLAYDVEPPCSLANTPGCQTLPVAVDSSGRPITTNTTSLVPTIGVTSVTFTLSAPKSAYVYTVAAEPLGADSSPTSSLGAVGSGDTCGFALPGTGQYASQLCFFDFSKYFAGGATPNNTSITEYVPGGYKLTATLTVTGASVRAATFPTYPEAFLGNTSSSGVPFYSGVGCPSSDPTRYQSGGNWYGTTSCTSPAIYQSSSGYSTVSLTNISLTTADGTNVSGYEIVTTDAETTDQGESIAWSSNVPFNQIPNVPGEPRNPSSLEGNACSTINNNDQSSVNYGGDITDANGQPLSTPVTNALNVTCNSSWSSSLPRTGALMLEVSPPASGNGVPAPTGANGHTWIQAVLHGAGLEGVSFGLLLP